MFIIFFEFNWVGTEQIIIETKKTDGKIWFFWECFILMSRNVNPSRYSHSYKIINPDLPRFF